LLRRRPSRAAGRQPPRPADRIAWPLYLIFPERDAFIPADEVRRIEARLRELGKDFRLAVYAGADRGLFNEERSAIYHPEAARRA
jgi:dienelactone hydrolase